MLFRSYVCVCACVCVCVRACACVCRPFRLSLSSFTRVSCSQVQELSLQGDSLLKDISLVGGNDSGIFISSVQSGSSAERAGLREGHHLILVSTALIIQIVCVII